MLQAAFTARHEAADRATRKIQLEERTEEKRVGGRGAEIFMSTLTSWATLSLVRSGIKAELQGPQPDTNPGKVWLRVSTPFFGGGDGVPVRLVWGGVDPPPAGILLPGTTAQTPGTPAGQGASLRPEDQTPFRAFGILAAGGGGEGILHHPHSPCQGGGGRGGMSHGTPVPNGEGIPELLGSPGILKWKAE